MSWSSSRTLAPVGIVVSMVVGCAWLGQSPKAEPQPGEGQAEAQPGQTLTTDDIERVAPGQPVELMLGDRFSGVEVARTSSGEITIRIRGPLSFYGSGEPLFVIDGIPINVGPSGLTGINPHDIASITVLKNPTDTAIYGLRGTNGVILITTKRPGK